MRHPVNLRRRGPTDRRAGLPLAIRLPLLLGVIILCAVVLVAGGSELGRIVAAVRDSLAGIAAQVKPQPTPSPTIIPLLDSPALISSDPYTNQPTVDLSGTLPTEVVGQPGYRIRIYERLGKLDNPSALVREQAVGDAAQFTIAEVILTTGVDYFTATLVGPGGETKPSAAIRVVYLVSPPPIVLTAPQDGQVINASSVQLDGRTRAGAVVVARDEASGASVTGTAGPDDRFSLTIGLEPGVNGITLTATDAAGNTNSRVVSVVGGNGHLVATLSSSPDRVSVGQLPASITLTALVLDPDGRPLAGADVVFTISIPGVAPITHDGTTDGAGSAILAITAPRGASPGDALMTVLVNTQSFGSVGARAVLGITP